MTQRNIIIPTKTVDEGNSCVVDFDLEDPSGNAVANTEVSTALMTIYNFYDGSTIMEATSVASGFDANGNFSWTVSGEYNEMVATANSMNMPYEDHIANIVINFTSDTVSHTLKKNIRIRVNNLRFI